MNGCFFPFKELARGISTDSMLAAGGLVTPFSFVYPVEQVDPVKRQPITSFADRDFAFGNQRIDARRAQAGYFSGEVHTSYLGCGLGCATQEFQRFQRLGL